MNACVCVWGGSGAILRARTQSHTTRLLVGALISLPEDLGNAMLVLALLPAPFSFDAATALLAHPESPVQVRHESVCCVSSLDNDNNML